MARCYIMDIDGTVADNTHRLHYIHNSLRKKDWDGFHAACELDVPYPHMLNLVRLLHLTAVVWVSGRPEKVREATQRWLYQHGFTDGGAPLYMRGEKDFRADDIIKEELLARLRADGWEPIMAFDDRNRVVEMWRRLGIPCAQVREGNF